MHPPRFDRTNHTPADWPDCRLELRCGCGKTTIYPVAMLPTRLRQTPLWDIALRRLKCQDCDARPAPVYLCAGHHRAAADASVSPDWAVELVPPP